MEKEKTERRSFFKKITAAVLGATLLGGMNIKQATAVDHDVIRVSEIHSGTGQTLLTSSTTNDTLDIRNSSTSGNAIRAHASGGTCLYADSDHTNAIPIKAVGHTTQIADLQRWQVHSSIKTRVNKDGWLGIGTSPARSIHLRGNNAVFRMDRNVNSSAFILVRTNPIFTNVWKTFYVGVDASGDNNGEFFIGDAGTNVSGNSTKRLRIYDNGDVWVKKLLTGDIELANDFIVTEDYEKTGIAFKNNNGEKIAVLDREGNFHIKGKVMEDL